LRGNKDELIVPLSIFLCCAPSEREYVFVLNFTAPPSAAAKELRAKLLLRKSSHRSQYDPSRFLIKINFQYFTPGAVFWRLLRQNEEAKDRWF
jgi:hypothetical protein